MALTWNNSNGWADSSGDSDDPNVPHTEEGQSKFGEDVICEMKTGHDGGCLARLRQGLLPHPDCYFWLELPLKLP